MPLNPDNLLKKLLANHSTALFTALINSILNQVIGHIIMPTVDQSHHQVAGHAAECLSLGMSVGKKLGNVFLVTSFTHHKDQLEIISIIKTNSLSLTFRHYFLNSLPVSLLGITTGKGE